MKILWIIISKGSIDLNLHLNPVNPAALPILGFVLMVVAGLIPNLGQMKLELLLLFFSIDWPGFMKQPCFLFLYFTQTYESSEVRSYTAVWMRMPSLVL